MGSSKKKSAHLRRQREDKLAVVKSIRENLGDRIRKSLGEDTRRLDLLESVAKGLYEEVDKLTKKTPGTPVTDLVVEQVNDVLQETRTLVPSDPFVQKLKDFVPAGDNPEHRDVTVVLKQVLNGMVRFRGQISTTVAMCRVLIKEADIIGAAIEFYLEGDGAVSAEELGINPFGTKEEPRIGAWFGRGYPSLFDFERLDRMSVEEHFNVATTG